MALSVLRNRAPVSGADTDPAQQVRSAAKLLYFIATLNIVLGVVATEGNVEAMARAGMGIFSVIFGVVTGVLGGFTTSGARVAPMVADILYVADSLVTVADTAMAGGRPSVVGLIFRV